MATIELHKTNIPDLFVVATKRFGDDRGWFTETWAQNSFAIAGIETDWVQDNHSMSKGAGTLRGLHYQAPPHAQAKLVRCTHGRIWDVAVDFRPNSPTYLQYYAIELSSNDLQQLFIPAGFLHGFVTLEPNSEIQYKCSTPYVPESDRAICWSDPLIDIKWPIDYAPTLSPKDASAPLVADVQSPF